MRLSWTGSFAAAALAAGASAAAPPPARNAMTGMNMELAQRVIANQQTPSTEEERRRSPLQADPARRVEFFRPADLDPGSRRFLKDHVVITRSDVRPNGLLFVFFPGTFGRPNNNQWVLEAAAREGYRAIGLEYVNTTDDPARSSLVQICGPGKDPACAGGIRRARWFGGDGGMGVSVAPADAALNRLVRLLKRLDQLHPGEGWGGDLKGDGMDWSRVVVGGHSQGAGMAAFIAKRERVARVVLMSGGPDAQNGDYAAWVKAPAATPGDRWYGLTHAAEPGSAGLVRAYKLLGAPGEPAAPGDPGFATAHIFVVSTPPRAGGLGDPAHGSVAADQVTPLSHDGEAAFMPVWRQMLRVRAAP